MTIMHNERDAEFSTRDLYLASALVSKKFYMSRVDFQLEGDKTVGYFNFENSQELEQTEKDYWQGKLLVEPREFVTAMRGLKAQVSNVYKNPRYSN